VPEAPGGRIGYPTDSPTEYLAKKCGLAFVLQALSELQGFSAAVHAAPVTCLVCGVRLGSLAVAPNRKHCRSNRARLPKRAMIDQAIASFEQSRTRPNEPRTNEYRQ